MHLDHTQICRDCDRTYSAHTWSCEECCGFLQPYTPPDVHFSLGVGQPVFVPSEPVYPSLSEGALFRRQAS